jgi:hypothetical protein
MLADLFGKLSKLRTLATLFGRSEAGTRAPAATRTRPPACLHVEELGQRILPATGLQWAIRPPLPGVAYRGPTLAGKSVEITGLVQGSSRDIGTVRFTWMDGYGNFRGTFESHLSGCWCPFGHQAEFYEASTDIGPIAISGHVSNGILNLGGGYSYAITFSGAGDGMVMEHHHYLYDNPSNPKNDPLEGTPEDENFMVSDHQTISFSGGLVESGAALTLNGNVAVTNSGAWLRALDHLAPNDPNHHTAPAPDWLVQMFAQSYTAQISDAVM